MLAKYAATTLSSKLIGGEKEFFASLVVGTCLLLVVLFFVSGAVVGLCAIVNLL